MLLSIYLASQQFLGISVTAILRYISGVLCIGDVFFGGGDFSLEVQDQTKNGL